MSNPMPWDNDHEAGATAPDQPVSASGSDWFSRHPVMAGVISVVGVLLLIGWYVDRQDGGASDIAQAAAQASTPPPAASDYQKMTDREWQLIARAPDAHVGEAVLLYGQITQADASTGDVVRANTGGEFHASEYGFADYDVNTLLRAGGAADLNTVVADDIVAIAAVVEGSSTYETTLGGDLTVPVLTVYEIKPIT